MIRRQPAAQIVLILYLYPASAAWFQKSTEPDIGAYSLAYLMCMLLLSYLLVLLGSSAGHPLRQICALYGLFVLSYGVGANLGVTVMPGMRSVLACARAASVFLALLLLHTNYREFFAQHARAITASSSLIISVCCGDLLLTWSLTARPLMSELRKEYDLTQIQSGDVILVGDSFVWGQGVAAEEAFGSRLETILKPITGAHVFSLGMRGASTKHYRAVLHGLPWAGKRVCQVILAFYLNDLPPRRRIHNRAVEALDRIGRSSMSFRLMANGLRKLEWASVDDYFASIVEDYDQRFSDYQPRRDAMTADLRDFADTSLRLCSRKPIFVIIPLLIDFATYPLTQAHLRLAELSQGLGFSTLDLLPVFTEKLGDGRRYRLTENDNHFTAEVHALAAETISRRILEGADCSDEGIKPDV